MTRGLRMDRLLLAPGQDDGGLHLLGCPLGVIPAGHHPAPDPDQDRVTQPVHRLGAERLALDLRGTGGLEVADVARVVASLVEHVSAGLVLVAMGCSIVGLIHGSTSIRFLPDSVTQWRRIVREVWRGGAPSACHRFWAGRDTLRSGWFSNSWSVTRKPCVT